MSGSATGPVATEETARGTKMSALPEVIVGT